MAALSKKDKQKAGYAALSSADEDDIYSSKDGGSGGGGGGGLQEIGSNQIPPYGAPRTSAAPFCFSLLLPTVCEG
jgi:hypothetical protein